MVQDLGVLIQSTVGLEQDFRNWVGELGFRVSGFGFQASGSWCRVSGLGLRVWGLGLRV